MKHPDSRTTTFVEALAAMALTLIPSWYTIDPPKSGEPLGSFADRSHFVFWAWTIGTFWLLIHTKYVLSEQRDLNLEEPPEPASPEPAENNLGDSQETTRE